MTENVTLGLQPLPVAFLVLLVNNWGDAPRASSNQSDHPYPTMDRLREKFPEYAPWVEGVDEATMVETANLVYPVYAASTGGDCAERLNDLVAQSGLAPMLGAEDWQIREVWRATRPGRELMAAAALTMIEQMRADPDASRLGTCAGDDCTDVYVDHSRAGRRSFCCVGCQNRARSRAYRARKKAAAGTA